MRLINAGKVSNVFEEEDDDHEECEQSIALIAKWESEHEAKQTKRIAHIDDIDNKLQVFKQHWNSEKQKWESEKRQWELDKLLLHKKVQDSENLRRAKEEELQKLLSQSQTYVADNNFQELIIKNEPNVKDKQMKECDSTEMDDGEEYSTTLMVLDSSDNYENYEMITDETNNYSSMFDDEDESESGDVVLERKQSNYILSGNDDEIEISFADVDADSQKEDDGKQLPIG